MDENHGIFHNEIATNSISEKDLLFLYFHTMIMQGMTKKDTNTTGKSRSILRSKLGEMAKSVSMLMSEMAFDMFGG